MLINFLDPKCKPVASSSVPCSDGYDVDNLISSNAQVRSNGFLAYSCIRPPVDLEFNLICSINLHYIVVIPSVGAQKSTGFELFLKNRSTDCFQPVSMTHLQNDEAGVVFYNGRTFQQKKYDNIPPNFKLCPLKNTQWRLISTCDRLKLRILRTKNSVPCIGKVEIWGCISKACPSARKTEVLEMVNTTPVVSSVAMPSTPVPAGKRENVQQQIPEEFLDSLTFEVMSLPVTLPSGNTVDQSTLEKHNQTQETWGRKPFDPFTGQTFTDSFRPVFNSALKNRIDNFLLQNQDEAFAKNIPRTVGRKVQSTKRCWAEAMEKNANSTADNNLDLILNSTLSKLKRFTTVSPTDNLQTNCVICKCLENLYILKCTHLYCRSCLTKTLSERCVVCNKYFQRCDINRYHV